MMPIHRLTRRYSRARHATIRQANDALIPATLERVFGKVGAQRTSM